MSPRIYITPKEETKMLNSTITIRLNEKEARDLKHMSEEVDKVPHVFARNQFGLHGIEILPRWVLRDVSRGCISQGCRGLEECRRCKRVRYMGRGSGICFDCDARAATACEDRAHVYLKQVVGARFDWCWCADCGAALTIGDAEVPIRAPNRVERRVIDSGPADRGVLTVSVPATLDDPKVQTPTRLPRRGYFFESEDRPFDCTNVEESRLESDFYVTVDLSHGVAAAVEMMAGDRGVTPEDFLRRHIGLFRFGCLPDWMRADAAQGCVSCASWRDCPRCAERRLIGRGAEHCSNCAACGIDLCAAGVHQEFVQVTSMLVEDWGTHYRCVLCNAAFGGDIDGNPSIDASGRTPTEAEKQSATRTRLRSAVARDKQSESSDTSGSSNEQSTEPAILEAELSWHHFYEVERVLREIWHSDDWITAARIGCRSKGSSGTTVIGERAHLVALTDAIERAAAIAEAEGSSSDDDSVFRMMRPWNLRSAVDEINKALNESEEA